MSPHSTVAQKLPAFFIYGDEERKFPVMHRLINLSCRSNQLSELTRQSNNRARVRRSANIERVFCAADRLHTSQNAPSTHNRYDPWRCGSKIGCAVFLKKKSPPRKRKHQLRGCHEGGGRRASKGRLIVRIHFLTI